jgi:hypothetical protein
MSPRPTAPHCVTRTNTTWAAALSPKPLVRTQETAENVRRTHGDGIPKPLDVAVVRGTQTGPEGRSSHPRRAGRGGGAGVARPARRLPTPGSP